MEYNLKIMAERLSKIYGNENAKRIMLENKDNLFGYKGLAYSLGKRDMTFFNLYFLKDVYVGEDLSELAPIHYTLWETMEGMYVDDTHDRHAFILPRGTGKSVTGSLPIAIWANLYGYSTYTVIASAVHDTAMSFIRNIRNALIDNERVEKAFGKVYDTTLNNTTDRIELANGTLIQSLSSRSTFRGKSYNNNRIGLLILDDYQSEKNTSTPDQMEKHWKRFSDDSANAIQKDNYKMIAMGTIIKQGDFYDRLSTLPTWKHTKEKAIQVEDVDRLFNNGKWKEFRNILFNTKDKARLDNAKRYYQENEEELQFPMLWDSYWDCLEMALQYYENPESFKQELQLEFGAGSTSKKFKNITYYEDDYKGNVLVIDPATSSKKGSDYTAFVVGGYDNDKIKVSYSHIDRLDFEDYISKTVEIIKENEEIDTVVIEKQTYNGSDVIAIKNVISRDMELYYRDMKWINPHQSKNKDNKINSIVGDVNLGRVQIHQKDKDSKAIEQLRSFIDTANSPYDDYPDALSELIIYLKEDSLHDNIVEVFDGSLLY